jgi:hypothetical protein
MGEICQNDKKCINCQNLSFLRKIEQKQKEKIRDQCKKRRDEQKRQLFN